MFVRLLVRRAQATQIMLQRTDCEQEFINHCMNYEATPIYPNQEEAKVQSLRAK